VPDVALRLAVSRQREGRAAAALWLGCRELLLHQELQKKKIY
jgi:hypothetical protein